ncbi:uncharacterized protein LOC112023799 [Quercus suber]|uniref:uncharacterized protein LOC112023799 n=1 Tax=Quercus suber TaxID=58331 RepID=UPI0032DEEAA2
MLCIKEGDNNTKFFHKMANSRRRHNHINMLEVDGVIYEDEPKMADQAVQFYKKLYKETEEWRPCVEGLEFDQIEGLERDWLERRFEQKEVLRVVKEMEGDKAPGPDGFSLAFYHHCWEVVERDVLAVFEEFYQHIVKDLEYLDSREWVKVEGNSATVGIIDHSQDHLGDVVYVELLEVGDPVSHGSSFGAVEVLRLLVILILPFQGNWLK